MARALGRGDAAESGSADEVRWQIEVRVVEDIERLGAQLHREALASDGTTSATTCSDASQTGAIQNVAARIAKCAARWHGERAVLNQRSGVGSCQAASPLTFGRSLAPKPNDDRPVPELSSSDGSATVNGRPDCIVRMPFSEKPRPDQPRTASRQTVPHVEIGAAALGADDRANPAGSSDRRRSERSPEASSIDLAQV